MGFFGSQGCSVIATNCCEIHSWMSVPWAEDSESSHGEEAGFASFRLGLFRQIPKASFLCGLFQNLLKVPEEIYFLIKIFLHAWGPGQKIAEQMLDLKLSQFSHLTASLLICPDVNEMSLSFSHSGKRQGPKKLESSHSTQEKQHERTG